MNASEPCNVRRQSKCSKGILRVKCSSELLKENDLSTAQSQKVAIFSSIVASRRDICKRLELHLSKLMKWRRGGVGGGRGS